MSGDCYEWDDDAAGFGVEAESGMVITGCSMVSRINIAHLDVGAVVISPMTKASPVVTAVSQALGRAGPSP